MLWSRFTLVALVLFGLSVRSIAEPLTSPPSHPIDNWLYYEQLHNEMKNDTSVFSPLDMDKKLPKEFNPRKGAKFEIGYIEIPTTDTHHFVGSNLSENAK